MNWGQLLDTFFSTLVQGFHDGLWCSNGAFPLHGKARYGSVQLTFGGFPLGTVPGTFLVPPRPGFQAIRTVTKT